MTPRRWPGLVLLALVVGCGAPLRAQQGLGGFTSSTGEPTCTTARMATPSAPKASYKADAPWRTSLREPGLDGTPLRLTGMVIGLRCGAIAGARIEFWQADRFGVFDMAGFRLRGQQRTDQKGRYVLETIVPGERAGEAKSIHALVTLADGTALSTQIFVPGDAAVERDPSFRPSLVMTEVASPGGKTATFDFVLDR